MKYYYKEIKKNNLLFIIYFVCSIHVIILLVLNGMFNKWRINCNQSIHLCKHYDIGKQIATI